MLERIILESSLGTVACLFCPLLVLTGLVAIQSIVFSSLFNHNIIIEQKDKKVELHSRYKGMSQSIPGRPIAPSPLPLYLLDTFNISTAAILVLLEWLLTLFYHLLDACG